MSEGKDGNEVRQPKAWRRKPRRQAIRIGTENDPGQEVNVLKRLEVISQANNDNDGELKRNKPPHW